VGLELMKAGPFKQAPLVKALLGIAAMALPVLAWAQATPDVEPAEPVAWQLNMTPGVTHTAQMAYDAHMFALWVCVAIGVLVFGAMAVAMFRFRKSKGAVAAIRRRQYHLTVVYRAFAGSGGADGEKNSKIPARRNSLAQVAGPGRQGSGDRCDDTRSYQALGDGSRGRRVAPGRVGAGCGGPRAGRSAPLAAEHGPGRHPDRQRRL
jgi:hypothetical protein